MEMFEEEHLTVTSQSFLVVLCTGDWLSQSLRQAMISPLEPCMISPELHPLSLNVSFI